MENTLVAQVLLHFLFDRFDIGKDVGVGDHHTAGLGGGSRSEDNLQRVVARKLRRSIGSSGVCCDRLAQRFEHQHGNGDAGGRNGARAHDELGVDLRCHAGGEFRGGNSYRLARRRRRAAGIPKTPRAIPDNSRPRGARFRPRRCRVIPARAQNESLRSRCGRRSSVRCGNRGRKQSRFLRLVMEYSEKNSTRDWRAMGGSKCALDEWMMEEFAVAAAQNVPAGRRPLRMGPDASGWNDSGGLRRRDTF